MECGVSAKKPRTTNSRNIVGYENPSIKQKLEFREQARTEKNGTGGGVEFWKLKKLSHTVSRRWSVVVGERAAARATATAHGSRTASRL